ncbi:MAG TPA: DUF819 family protein [Longimicrobiales bacterium]|nr:DUF819 family protein [Longimicrobiales bacterium]
MIRDPLLLSAVIAGITALAFWLDHRFAALSRLGASLLAIVLGAAISNLGLVPVSSGVYDLIMGPLTSLAIAWLLLSVSLADVKKAGPAMLSAYGLAALGTALGAFVAAILFAGVFGDDTWRLAGVMTGTYTGGSLNFVAVGREVGLPDALFAGANAADALTTALWMGATLVLPVWLARFYPTPVPDGPPAERTVERDEPAPRRFQSSGAGDPEGVPHPFFFREAISTLDLAVLGALGIGLLVGAALLEQLVPQVPSILWLTTLALIVGNLPGLRIPKGGFQLGTLALHFFFVVIGIFSRVSEILAVGLEVFWLTLVVVGIHGVVVYGGGRLARLDVGSLSVASQAAVGGPSSALAVAVSREWSALVLPGVAVGLLGYAVGNYLGIGVANLVRTLGFGL